MKAIVLAGGKGRRLHSDEVNIPKALKEVNGKPLISYVLRTIDFIDPEDIHIVIGFQGEKVKKFLGTRYTYVEQKEQLGTGHAVFSAAKAFEGYTGDVCVLYGDMPLISQQTIKEMIQFHQSQQGEATLLTAVVPHNPPPYGRIIRDQEGRLMDIVEVKDCTPEQAAIPELNVGAYVFNSTRLFHALAKVKNENAQKEYLLTDVPRIMLEEGGKVITYGTSRNMEIYGVNTFEELELCSRLLKNQ